MKKLTLQEMTDTQQMRVRTRIGQERKKLGRELTNAEMNKVKNAIITEISLEVEKASKKALSQKKKQKNVVMSLQVLTRNCTVLDNRVVIR